MNKYYEVAYNKDGMRYRGAKTLKDATKKYKMTREKETKTCQNCKSEFVIEPEDFDFYPPSHEATARQARKS